MNNRTCSWKSNQNSQADYEEIINVPSMPLVSSPRKMASPLTKQKQKISHSFKTFDKNKYFMAAHHNDLEWIQSIDWTKHDINVLDQFGWSAAMIASCEDARNVLKFLIGKEIDLTISDGKGNTAMSLAAKKNNNEIMKLISLGNIKKENQRTGNQKKPQQPVPEPFFCEQCQKDFTSTSRKVHETSTLHLFNQKDVYRYPRRFGIPESNVGFQLMIKQGWDRESGLGASKEGPLYPVKTTIRKSRTGLGTKQDSARVTHFAAYDRDAIKWRRPAPKPKTRRDLERDKRRERRQEIKLRNALS